jgi:predicted flap endonuclease-1-like 5' DNA nuclease
MDGVLWFLAQLTVYLGVAAVTFFVLGWKMGARGPKKEIRDLETRLDEEDRARKLALEERDAARRELQDAQPQADTGAVSEEEWEESQQQQRALEREVLRLSDELKASKAAPEIESEDEPSAQQPKLELELESDDDLTRIKGIGAVIATKLKAVGIKRFAQIADWTDEEMDQFGEQLAFRGRAKRDRWREQARELAEG